MIFVVRVFVRLRESVHDPQGEAIHRALRTGPDNAIRSVRQGKVFDLQVEANSPDEASARAEAAAKRVLSNPVIEDYAVQVRGTGSGASKH